MAKKHFIKNAKGYFSTSKEHDNYYITYGAKKNKIHRYNFTSLYKKDIIQETISNNKKNELRKKLCVKEKYIILTVGQFIKRKGFDVLINASKLLPDDVGIYFIGGTPTDEYKKLSDGKDNIHFVGFKEKNNCKNII